MKLKKAKHWSNRRDIDAWVADAEKDIRKIAESGNGNGVSMEHLRRTVHNEFLLKKRYAENWAKCVAVLEEAGVYRKMAEDIAPANLTLDLGCGFASVRPHLKTQRYIGLDNNPFCLYEAKERTGAHLFARAGWGSYGGRLIFSPKFGPIDNSNGTSLMLFDLMHDVGEYMNHRTTRTKTLLDQEKIKGVDSIISSLDGGSAVLRGTTIQGSDGTNVHMDEGSMYVNAVLFNAEVLLNPGGRFYKISRFEDTARFLEKEIKEQKIGLEIVKTNSHPLPREPESGDFFIYENGPVSKQFHVTEMVKK